MTGASRRSLVFLVFNVFIEHERINRVRVTKFLGIYIDDKLNWKYHINTVRSKLSKVAAIIYRASCLINQDGIYVSHLNKMSHMS